MLVKQPENELCVIVPGLNEAENTGVFDNQGQALETPSLSRTPHSKRQSAARTT